MLDRLKIKNIAVIDETEIPFRKGLNILSGETGAGKSIVINAIGLILGGRATAELIREGCEEGVVEGLFDLSDLPWMRERLERLGFSPDADELLVKRVVSAAGRHRIYVNGELATAAILHELCEGLVDLCGQHEHQSLIKPQTQMDLLDRYGSLLERAARARASFISVRDLRAELESLRSSEEERSRRLGFLEFQIQELRAADLKPGEDESLQTEKRLLQSTEFRLQLGEHIRQSLEGEPEGVLDPLRGAVAKARALADVDPSTRAILEGMERAAAELEEALLEVSRYLDAAELNPDRLQAVQDRLATLADLRRKYGASVNEMLATAARLEAELSALGHAGNRIEALQTDLEKGEAELYKLGKDLSAARRKAAKLLSDSVTGELKDLKMPDAVFEAQLESREDLTLWSAWACGDLIQFLIQTNRGDKSRPLGKVASGGELSRIMLAIRRVIADKGGIGVYLFDEIDAGIGGQTAFEVGRKLASVAKFNQVICITHLPQVAAFGDHHLSVRKEAAGRRTVTRVLELDAKERKAEIARMLAGPQITKTSLQSAGELLGLAAR
ncbi:MAG: DNA repair protein RecN [Bdellovibrionales bacterium]|nr:DNA repair protein RecN [Bdellovibrionales bacterium]